MLASPCVRELGRTTATRTQKPARSRTRTHAHASWAFGLGRGTARTRLDVPPAAEGVRFDLVRSKHCFPSASSGNSCACAASVSFPALSVVRLLHPPPSPSTPFSHTGRDHELHRRGAQEPRRHRLRRDPARPPAGSPTHFDTATCWTRVLSAFLEAGGSAMGGSAGNSLACRDCKGGGGMGIDRM